jgi:tetratricopeptide (TPR) repeat protein
MCAASKRGGRIQLSGLFVRLVIRRQEVPHVTETKKHTVVIVSSTARDLPEHRKDVLDACLRQGMLPLMMEHLPASDAEAISASLKLVDDADIYVGVFAHRYGYVPKENNPRQISVTEMEYDRAVKNKMPRLIFVMDKSHPLTIDDVEQGEGAIKLKAFKERLRTDNIVNFFNSPADLRAHVINSLSQHREPDLTTFHYVSDIPPPPEAFIAHPYTLLQTHRLVGRQPELNLLTDWVAKPDAGVFKARILNVVAVGGMGKSALTWKWFNEIAPQEMSPLAGRMWWSFYESDATFENFVTRALAYVTRRPLAEVQTIPAPERETQLLTALDHEPYLFVLDGLERMLIAYARMDAAHLSDDDYDKQTANVVANAIGLPASAAQSFTGEHRLRKTADPRAGSFLRKLANVRASRVLVSTRLYPADLQMMTGAPLPGCAAKFLEGLVDDDALELWRAFDASGARDLLLPIFNRVGNHSLLIQALASEVARYRPAPGDFDRWRRDNPDFDPFSLPLVQVKSHVLAFALRGLDEKAQQVLRIIAAFRMPARYDTLMALISQIKVQPKKRGWLDVLTGKRKEPETISDQELDAMLVELEDRGLVGWDKRANRYDLHPIVRGVVWSGLGDDARRGVYTSLHAHFEAVPMIDDYLKVNSLEDLTPAIELYNTLIGLGRYDDACNLFYARLDDATLWRLSASRQRVELLEMLFPDGLNQLPRLTVPNDQGYTLDALANGYDISGQPGRSAPLRRQANTIASEMENDNNLSISLCNLSNVLRLSGALCESESAARRALVITREQDNRFQEAVSLYWLGLTLAARGLANKSESALQRALRLFRARSHSQSEGVVNSYLAQRALWLSEFAGALSFANRAWELAHVERNEGDFIRAARVQGEAALGLNDLATANERLHHALTRARMVNLVDEELPALVALAELRRQQGEAQAAREFLHDVREAAERGPYRLIHADACNVLAQIERDAGQQAQAITAATEAYRLAWCDGPPFAYHWGLEKARALLKELGAGEPEMPPFDASKFEPMPEVEIDPPDEFGARSGEGK